MHRALQLMAGGPPGRVTIQTPRPQDAVDPWRTGEHGCCIGSRAASYARSGRSLSRDLTPVRSGGAVS